MKRQINWLLNPPVDGPNEILILRFMTGSVFFWEGILKFLYPNQGVGRFTKLDFMMPVFTANAIATLEIVGGLLLVLGLMTRITAIIFIFEMICAMLFTKVSLYLGTSPLPLPSSPPQIGIWAVLHEIRSEYTQTFTCLFLLMMGPGKKSIDYYLK